MALSFACRLAFSSNASGVEVEHPGTQDSWPGRHEYELWLAAVPPQEADYQEHSYPPNAEAAPEGEPTRVRRGDPAELLWRLESFLTRVGSLQGIVPRVVYDRGFVANTPLQARVHGWDYANLRGEVQGGMPVEMLFGFAPAGPLGDGDVLEVTAPVGFDFGQDGACRRVLWLAESPLASGEAAPGDAVASSAFGALRPQGGPLGRSPVECFGGTLRVTLSELPWVGRGLLAPQVFDKRACNRLCLLWYFNAEINNRESLQRIADCYFNVETELRNILPAGSLLFRRSSGTSTAARARRSTATGATSSRTWPPQ